MTANRSRLRRAAVAACATRSLNSTWFGRPVSASTRPARRISSTEVRVLQRRGTDRSECAEQPKGLGVEGKMRDGGTDDQPLAVAVGACDRRAPFISRGWAHGDARVLAAQKTAPSSTTALASTSSASTKPWISTEASNRPCVRSRSRVARSAAPRKSCKPMSSGTASSGVHVADRPATPARKPIATRNGVRRKRCGNSSRSGRDERIVQCEPEVQRRAASRWPSPSTRVPTRGTADEEGPWRRRCEFGAIARPPPRPRGRDRHETAVQWNAMRGFVRSSTNPINVPSPSTTTTPDRAAGSRRRRTLHRRRTRRRCCRSAGSRKAAARPRAGTTRTGSATPGRTEGGPLTQIEAEDDSAGGEPDRAADAGCRGSARAGCLDGLVATLGRCAFRFRARRREQCPLLRRCRCALPAQRPPLPRLSSPQSHWSQVRIGRRGRKL